MKTLPRIALVAVGFAVAGALATLPFVLQAENVARTARTLAPAAAVAAGLLGVAAWETMVQGNASRKYAPLAGALVGLAAHPLMWALIALGVGNQIGASASEQVTGSIVSSMFFGFISMLAYGIVTVPMGALTGWVLGRIVQPGGRQ